jgi:hypothetical protein
LKELHNELYNLYSSSNIIRLIKLRRMGWAGHVAHMGEMRNAYKNCCQETSSEEYMWEIEMWIEE